jgi:para-nitrobenzyl esterase
MRLASLLLLASVVASPALAADPIKIDSGLVAGVAAPGDTHRIYKGIPFAAPPTGERRWKAPQPVQAWSDVLQAVQYPPMCMQNLRYHNSIFYQGEEAMAEDCLYLNVWTPAKAATDKLPVMVFVYGGGFRVGSSAMPTYRGDGLARKGAVVVTFNYRVGVLGFLAHPELTKEAKSSGNYALMDMIAALEWVKRNIAAFGGDPGRVTIFGQSAGAVAESYLMASPRAKGLFHRVIGESLAGFNGSGGKMSDLDKAEQAGAAFAKAVNATSLAELRNKPADELIRAPWNVAGIVDGNILPDDVDTIFAKQRHNDVPLLVGSNSDEGTPYPQADTAARFVEQARTRYGDDAGDFLKLYPARSDAEAKESGYASMRDGQFAWQVWKWARMQTALGNAPAYLYYFGRRPPFPAESVYRENPGPKLGAHHGAEIVYAANNLDASKLPWTDWDRKLADAMSSYWVNFAATGDPNGSGLTPWPKFDTRSERVMHFGDKIEVGGVANKPGLEFFDAFYGKW